MKFATKIFLYIFLTSVLVFGGLTVFIHIWIVNHTLKDNLGYEKKMIRLVAMKSEDCLLKHEYMELHGFFHSILKADPYIDYMFAVTEDGPLVHTFETGIPKGLLQLPPFDETTGIDMIPVENEHGDIIYHLRCKIGVLHNAVLHAGVSDKKMRDGLASLRNLLFAAGVMVIVLVPLVLALFLSRLISKPFSLIRQAVHRIGGGELDYRLSFNAGKEIGMLVDDVNTMAQRLEKLRDGLEGEIEERKLAQRRLSKQTELLNTILHNVPHSIFWKDPDSVYLGCNRQFAKAAGFEDPAEVIGKADKELPWKQSERDFFRACDQRVLKGGESLVDIEETVTLVDGSERLVVTNKVPLRDNQGQIYGLLGIFYDVTDRKKMEEAIKQTQKIEAIGTLAGGIAHDFNNILSSIMGYTEMAFDDTPADQPSHAYLKQVLKSAGRAKELVRQILTFSRKNQEERKPIKLADIVEDEARLLRSTLPTTIEIRADIDENAGMVRADATQMHQVVMNLCTNAADSMRETSGVLDISLRFVELSQESIQKYHDVAPGPYVELKVTDTGMGIDSRIIHRIFEPFFTTKDMEKGTGMGLAVVHGIVKDHGGDIIVESHVGRGTTFTVLLPQVVGAHPETVKEKPKPVSGGVERILFVDDEKLLLDLGKKMLGSLGYSVTTVNGSLEALEQFKKTPDDFDLVITDQTMPHMTGFHLAKLLLEIRPSLPIIMCSGYSSDTISSVKATDAGIKAFMFKPFNKKELGAVVRKVLDGETVF